MDLVWIAQHSAGAASQLQPLTGGIGLDDLKGMEALIAASGGSAGLALAARWLWDRFYKAGADNWQAAREAMAQFAALAETQRAYLDAERAAARAQLEDERAAHKAQRDEVEARAAREAERVTAELELTRSKLEDERGRVDRALDEIRAAREREQAALRSSADSAQAAHDARRALEIAQEHKDQCERQLERLTGRVAELEERLMALGDEVSDPALADLSRTGRHKRVKTHGQGGQG